MAHRHIVIFGLVSKHAGRNLGGTALSIARLANFFVASGVAVDVLMLEPPGDHFLPRQLAPGVGLHFLHSPGKLGLFLGLRRFVRRRRPTAVLALDTRANLIASWLKMLPGPPVSVWASLRNTLNQRQGPAFRRIHDRCDGVIAISEGLAEEFRRLTGASSDKLQVIYNPAVTPEIQQLASQPAVHPWLLSGDRPVIMGIGRLVAQKDFATLLRAFARVRNHRLTRLIILGEGEQRSSLEALAAELGIREDVDFPGFQENPWAWLSRASLFVLSSRGEGFGNVLAEAMALGIPVVSTDCPFGPGEILDYGRLGPLVPVADSQALAAAIEETLDHHHPPEVLRAAARRFELAVSGEQYLRTMGFGEPVTDPPR